MATLSINTTQKREQCMTSPLSATHSIRGSHPSQHPSPVAYNYLTNQYQYQPSHQVPQTQMRSSIVPVGHGTNHLTRLGNSISVPPTAIRSLPTSPLHHFRPTSFAYSHFQGPYPLPPAVSEIPWRPIHGIQDKLRPVINVNELGGKQMLPLEPRAILEPTLDDITMTPMAQFSNIIEILRFRGGREGGVIVASTSISGKEKGDRDSRIETDSNAKAKAKAFSVIDNKGRETGSFTWEELMGRAEKISQTILQKTQLRQGARVGLVYRKSEILDFLAAFYGCMMAGMTAVPINVIEEFAEMVYILSYTQTELALTTEYNHKALTRDLNAHKDMDWPAGVTWWKTDTLGNGNWKQNKEADSSLHGGGNRDSVVSLPDLAYIEYTKSPSGELKGVAVSHRTIISQCHALKHALGSSSNKKKKRSVESDTVAGAKPVIGSSTTYKDQKMTSTSLPSEIAGEPELISGPGNPEIVLTWMEPRQQVGLVLGALLGVYRGSHTIFIHSGITETPNLWESCAQRYQATMAVGDYEGVRELMQNLHKKQDTQSFSLLSSLEKFLIDTVMVQPMVDRQLASEFLSLHGVTDPENVIIPISSLPEHGGMILSMKDNLMFPKGADLIDFGFKYDVPREPVLNATISSSFNETWPTRPRGHPTDSNTICHYLLDREALKNNIIQVVTSGEDAIQRSSEQGTILVGTFGYATPRATLAIVDPDTTALCQPNRVGEIWIDSPSIAFGFWELPKHSQSIFHALPLIVPVDTMIPEVYDPVPAGFLRTGLLGGLIEGRVVVFGLYEDRIRQETRQQESEGDSEAGECLIKVDVHYTADIANTIMEHISGFTNCVAFECYSNGERLPIICAETSRNQRVELDKLSDYIKQAMLDYHGLRPYCIAIAPPGTLPRTYKNGRRAIHPILCRKMLEQGRLILSHMWTSVENTVFNLAVGDDVQGGIWGPDALVARNAVFPAHTRMVQYSSCEYPTGIFDERSKIDLSQFPSLAELLIWRTVINQDEIAFLGLDHQGNNGKAVTFRKFGMKVVSIANYIEKRGGFRQGEKVVLLFPNGIEFVATMYAVWLLGLVPVPVAIPEPSRLHEDIVMLMGLLTEIRASNLIGNSVTEEIMKQKTTMIHIKACIGARQDARVPTVFNVSKAPKSSKGLGKDSGYTSAPRTALAKSSPAVIFAHYSTDMRRTLVKVSHASLLAQCRAFKVQCRLKSGKPLVSCWKALTGVGFLQSCGLGVYVGAPTVLIRYADFLASPQIYFEAIERHGARDVLVNYAMLEQALVGLDHQSSSKIDFSGVRNFQINAEERPRVEVHRAIEQRLCRSLSKDSTKFQMETRQICGMFGHMANPIITARSYMNIEPVRLHLSLKSLRRGIIEITNEEDDPTGIWIEDSGTPVCGTTVAIVNPETRELCLSREIGEIWVSSEANVQGHTPPISPLIIEADPSSVDSILGINARRFSATIASADGVMAGNSSTSSLSNANPEAGNITNANNDVRITAKSYVRTGEIGFLWNYAHENFNGGQPTSLLFVLGSIGETFEVNGLIHFPMDVEATIEKSHPNIAPSGSIIFQADQAVVCVIQARQLDSTIVNMTLSVMHQVMDKHQFMPDVIAIVGDDVLAKNRYGEKQRGKMLSLFMSAKMPLLYIHYPHGSLPQSIPEQMNPQSRSPGALSSTGYQSQENSNSSVTSCSGSSSPTTPTTYASSSLASLSNSLRSGQQVSTSSSNATAQARRKSEGSVRSNRSSISFAESIQSLRSVKSFVGSLFSSSKKNKSGNLKATSSLRGLHGSKSESGLQTLTEVTAYSEPLPNLKTLISAPQKISISIDAKLVAESSLKTPDPSRPSSAKTDLPVIQEVQGELPMPPIVTCYADQ
ncbi:hypothetical protein BGZ76_010766 [Entomortierella beljakovae]|nr:hypothetical protein BGZ76_010766 [Entomortierella beljakovae]